MTTNTDLTEKYATLIEPLLPLAKKAFGSRDTVSPQHDASREYTRLLVEFYNEGGSLLDMGVRIGVTYAGMRRRVTTADLPSSTKRPRKKFTEEEYTNRVNDIVFAKGETPEEYHQSLKDAFDDGYSLTKIAQKMGLSSANPLYWGMNRIKIAEKEAAKTI